MGAKDAIFLMSFIVKFYCLKSEHTLFRFKKILSSYHFSAAVLIHSRLLTSEFYRDQMNNFLHEYVNENTVRMSTLTDVTFSRARKLKCN